MERGEAGAVVRGSTALALAALALLALSAWVRLTGIDYLLPSFIEPDAHIPVQVELIETAAVDPEENSNYGKYPLLLAYVAAACTPRVEWDTPATASLAEHIAVAIHPVVRVRLVVAALSLLLLPATFGLARLVMPRGWALLAAALAGTNLLAVNFAVQARPHGAAAGLAVLGVLACVHLRRRPRAGSYLLAALGLAAAFGSLQSGVAVFIPLAVAHFLADHRSGRVRHLWWLWLIAAAAATVFLLYPFLLEGAATPGGGVSVSGAKLDQSGHKIFLDRFNGKGVPVLLWSVWSWDPVLAIGAVLGGIVWLWDLVSRHRSPCSAPLADRAVLLSFALPYAVVIGMYQRSYERFLLPLVPFLACLAAWGLWRLLSGRRPLLVTAVLTGVLAFPTVVVVRFAQLRSWPSTYEEAAAWMSESVDPESETVYLSLPMTMPLRSDGISLSEEKARFPGRDLGWYSYQDAVGDPVAGPAFRTRWLPLHNPDLRQWARRSRREFVHSLEGDYCINEVFTSRSVAGEVEDVRIGLQQEGKLLLRITPDTVPLSTLPLAYQEATDVPLPHRAVRVLCARALGPSLEVFRLPRGSSDRAESR